MPGTDDVFGLLRIAGLDVALPLSALREVVLCPPQLAGLPVPVDVLAGALEVRRLVVPVLDLRQVLRLPPHRAAGQVVVVIAHDDHVLGVLADEVRGITRLPVTDLLDVRSSSAGLLFSHTFRHPETGATHSVLDAQTLLSLPGVPAVHDAAPESALPGAGGSTGAVRRLTLLRCGEHVLGIDAGEVHMLLPPAPVLPSALAGGACRGMTAYGDRDVPVVDPLVLLGLGRLPADAIGPGVVLDLEHGYLVLAVDEMLQLATVRTADVLPLPRSSTSRPDLVSGLADVEGVGPCLVLAPGLGEERSLASLSALNTLSPAAEIRSAEGTGPQAAPPYLLFSAGTDLVTPLDGIAEILPLPASATRTGGSAALLGVVVHRRAAVPVVCLATLLGLPVVPAGPSWAVLLVDGDEPVAFAVAALRSIEPLTWSDDSPAGPAARGPEQVLRASRRVLVGKDERLLPDLDLRRLGAAVLDGWEQATEQGLPRHGVSSRAWT